MNKTDKKGNLSPMLVLPIYHEFRKFRKYMYMAIEKMPRWLKNSEGANCVMSIKTCVRCLSVVARTYDREVKLQYIDAFLTEWDVVSDSISFFHEAHGISNHQRAVMYKMREGIEGQVAALRKWWMETDPSHFEQNQKDLIGEQEL